MAYQVAGASVGRWHLTIDDIAPSNADAAVLELCIVGDDFDVSANLPSIDALTSLADAIESIDDVDVTAKERCFVSWTVANLFIFVDRHRFTFLLLDTVGDQKRFRISVPVAQKDDFLLALCKLKEEAEAELG